MSNIEGILVFVGIPAAVVALVFGAVYGTTARRVNKRYRPGRPFSFAPVWFLAAPADSATPDPAAANAALPAGERTAALPAGPVLAQADDALVAARSGRGGGVTSGLETGGASDTW